METLTPSDKDQHGGVVQLWYIRREQSWHSGTIRRAEGAREPAWGLPLSVLIALLIPRSRVLKSVVRRVGEPKDKPGVGQAEALVSSGSVAGENLM